MDTVLMARKIRLATIMNLFQQGLLEEKDAKELLQGPLAPGDDSTIVDDSRYFDNPDELIRAAELPDAPACGGAQVDAQSQDENDRPEACTQKYHDFISSNLLPYKYCPLCGERLLT